MAVTLVATPGATNANSYLTLAEANDYFDTRLFSDNWTDNLADGEKALMMATRTLDALAQPYKYYVADGPRPYYRTRPQWTGVPASATQALAWPRAGMYDAGGNLIASDVIPQALKNAVAELAMQLLAEDRTLDNDVSAKGIRSISAGPVSLSFKDSIDMKVIPDAVWNLLPPTWFTADVIEYVPTAQFQVII
jgi:hypothetical protein